MRRRGSRNLSRPASPDKQKEDPLSPLKPLSSEKTLDEALDAALSVIYKHSSRCWICTKAERQVHEFATEHPEVPVYQLDAVEGRDLVTWAGYVPLAPEALAETREVWQELKSSAGAADPSDA